MTISMLAIVIGMLFIVLFMTGIACLVKYLIGLDKSQESKKDTIKREFKKMNIDDL